MLDALTLATLPKQSPLTIRESNRPWTCAICGCDQESYTWVVNLPNRSGKACPGCATDHGFSVR